jgi:spermidine/putrescine ABC transporter ATP-binding subunit
MMRDAGDVRVGGLSVTSLTVRYGTIRAIDGLDLSVRSGELFALLGGSGSGKTTLLRSIAGFVQPETGRIELDGADLLALPPHRRPVNTMFQSYALFPHLTVFGNIAFGLRQRRMSRSAVRDRVAEMLALVRLEGFADRRPHQLSGGQQQRVALARSLAPNPALLLLDEPLSALDRGLRAETRADLVSLHRRIGTTFILVTHDQEEALTMADRIGVMKDGRMMQVGTPADVYEHPTSRFVAAFVGAANILPAVVRADGVTLDLPAQGVSVRSAVAGIAGPALLALRPERLQLGDASGVNHPGVNRLEGVVLDHDYGGESLTTQVRLADGSILRVTQSLVHGLGAARTGVGDRLWVSWDPAACMILNG